LNHRAAGFGRGCGARVGVEMKLVAERFGGVRETIRAIDVRGNVGELFDFESASARLRKVFEKAAERAGLRAEVFIIIDDVFEVLRIRRISIRPIGD